MTGRESDKLRAWEWKAMTEGIQENVWTCCRDKAPLLERGEEEGWASIENSLCPSMHAYLPTSRNQSVPSASPLPPLASRSFLPSEQISSTTLKKVACHH